MIDRRTFLAGLVAGAAGLLLPDPERRVFALDRTMIRPKRDLEFYKTHPVEYFQDYGSMVTPYPVMATGPHFVIGDYPTYIETGWFDASMPPIRRRPMSIYQGDQCVMVCTGLDDNGVATWEQVSDLYGSHRRIMTMSSRRPVSDCTVL